MATSAGSRRRRVGIVGFGNLGRYLCEEVLKRSDELELAFVWNRTQTAFQNDEFRVNESYILRDLKEFASRHADLIVEVAHPSVTAEYGVTFLKAADYMVGSPVAFADSSIEQRMREEAEHGNHGLYIPRGALWGGDDIRKMADRGTLKSLKITMKKHPKSFHLEEELAVKNSAVTQTTILYDGPVRALCPLAPHNVNTMATAAIAAHNLGFDKVQGQLVSDPSLTSHVIDIHVEGPVNEATQEQFTVHTVRNNPAVTGQVTGKATYGSFLSSMLAAHSRGVGIHLC
ncbi:aspartate dehydrogenase domain-containing protein-like [Corticium candelabrum]|uniref:aspartate dehydrogenase domain-containing protein-like n=1 Tax=Corticium candelabrum TaxID=121492 RepID=UPI002E270600|nr:aspartate dehydrogenase domain-containing protein-like [Corticium candelabrum]